MAQLILTWSAPSDCSGCTFEYRYKLSSASTYVTGATSNTIVTINNLIDAQTYNYSVRTVCPDAGGNLRSRWLNGSSVTCNTNPPLQPTPTPTITPTPTSTPTSTPTPTPTATVLTPTATPTPTPTPTTTVGSCLSGDLTSSGNCSSSDLASFTLSSGYQATITPSGFFYSGTGTRYAYAYLRTSTGTNIQQFTLTQVNSTTPTFSPSTYTITTPGSYQLYVQQVDCNQGGTGGSGTMSLTVGNCQVYTAPTPTPTPTPTAQPIYTFYAASQILWDNVGTTYCSEPGYIMSGPLYSLDATLTPGSTVLYTDYTLETEYVGGWTNSSNYRFAYITSTDHQLYTNYPSYPNTIDPDADGNMGGIFKFAGVDENGVVQTTGIYSCSGGGSGGGDGAIE
jgi:hypothetical protein